MKWLIIKFVIFQKLIWISLNIINNHSCQRNPYLSGFEAKAYFILVWSYYLDSLTYCKSSYSLQIYYFTFLFSINPMASAASATTLNIKIATLLELKLVFANIFLVLFELVRRCISFPKVFELMAFNPLTIKITIFLINLYACVVNLPSATIENPI